MFFFVGMFYSYAEQRGDVNDDGKITATDARITLRIASKLDTANEKQQTVCDVNNDEEITASDARKILRVSARIDSEEDLNVEPIHKHDFTYKTEVIEEGTCQKDRVIVNYCECGESEKKTEIIPHDFSAKYTIIKDPNCTESGYKAQLCKVCQQENKDSIIILDPISHDEMDGFCPYCAKTHTSYYDHDYTFWTETEIEATCATDGKEREYCVCGDFITNTIDSTGLHNFLSENVSVTTEPTCTENGFGFYICDSCNNTIFDEQVVIPATGHNFYSYYCESCNMIDTEYTFSLNETVSIPGEFDFTITDVIVDDFQYSDKRLIICYTYKNTGYSPNGYRESLSISRANISSKNENSLPWSIVQDHSFNSSARSCSDGEETSEYTTIFINNSVSTETIYIIIEPDIILTYEINLNECNSPSEKDYQEGYDAGYTAGLNDSNNQTDGYNDGYNDGSTNSSRIEKRETGSHYEFGFDYNKGYEHGFEDGCINAYNQYYKDGYNAGKNSGYVNDSSSSNSDPILNLLISKSPWISFLELDGDYSEFDSSWELTVSSDGTVKVSSPGYIHEYKAVYLGYENDGYYYNLKSSSYYDDIGMVYDADTNELALLKSSDSGIFFR